MEYLGTTFDRKDFNRMIQDIENKKINMIVTKDLSRLGRDYIKTGHYLENYFPENHVRYVAILDGIDTYIESTSNDITPFKAIMNDMYAKDISKKIKIVFREKQKNGQFLGSIPPYGYKLDENQKGKLFKDEYSAEIVKRIFEMYANGHGSIDILNVLNKENILTPSSYHKTKTIASSKWNQTTVLAILKNQAYLGHIVQNKINKISYKSKKVMKVPKEKWIIVENTHEPIINEELFERVQLIIRGKDMSKMTKHDYLFKGLMKCYHCNWTLQVALKSSGKKKTKNPYINCMGHERRGSHPISMNYWKFENQILETIRIICKMYLDDPMFLEVYKEHKSKTKNILDEYKKQLQNIETRINEIDSNMDKMYFDKLKDIITEDAYTRYSNQFTDERNMLINKAVDLQERINIIKGQEEERIDETEVKMIVKEFLEMKIVNKTILYRLIKKIQIDKDKNIYIHFNFNSLNIINDNMEIQNDMVHIKELQGVG
ncbi:MAG: recombinase family protein [Oscillospiraceae bacterium]|nr:recombinase family protein [Oscillospiraceae bacterium]